MAALRSDRLSGPRLQFVSLGSGISCMLSGDGIVYADVVGMSGAFAVARWTGILFSDPPAALMGIAVGMGGASTGKAIWNIGSYLVRLYAS